MKDKMSIVRKDSKPIENDEEGAYLSFDIASQGTLFLTWSKHCVPSAFMHFRPRKPVAGFKFTTNQGRTELIRDCQKDNKRYFQGWCAFMKAVRVSSRAYARLPARSNVSRIAH